MHTVWRSLPCHISHLWLEGPQGSKWEGKGQRNWWNPPPDPPESPRAPPWGSLLAPQRAPEGAHGAPRPAPGAPGGAQGTPRSALLGDPQKGPPKERPRSAPRKRPQGPKGRPRGAQWAPWGPKGPISKLQELLDPVRQDAFRTAQKALGHTGQNLTLNSSR